MCVETHACGACSDTNFKCNANRCVSRTKQHMSHTCRGVIVSPHACCVEKRSTPWNVTHRAQEHWNCICTEQKITSQRQALPRTCAHPCLVCCNVARQKCLVARILTQGLVCGNLTLGVVAQTLSSDHTHSSHLRHRHWLIEMSLFLFSSTFYLLATLHPQRLRLAIASVTVDVFLQGASSCQLSSPYFRALRPPPGRSPFDRPCCSSVVSSVSVASGLPLRALNNNLPVLPQNHPPEYSSAPSII